MITTIGRWAYAPELIQPIVGYRAWRSLVREMQEMEGGTLSSRPHPGLRDRKRLGLHRRHFQVIQGALD